MSEKMADAFVWDDHGLVIGGPDDGKIVTSSDYLKDGYVVGSNKDMRFHEYNVYERPNGTKFFLYSGSRRHLNG